MKIKRYKKVHKTLKFYSLNFAFRKPYQVLIDGPLCMTALKNKINLQDQLTKYLEGDAKLLTTQCIVKEVDALGPAFFGAAVIVKKFPVHQCGHGRVPVSGSECILSMIGAQNENRYIVASQDRDLQDECRKIVGVPLLYLHMTSPTLEAPSPISQEFADNRLKQQCVLRPHEQETIQTLKGTTETAAVRRGKKRPRGPNPLSCKKRKGNPGEGRGKPKEKAKKRVRNRSALVKKVRKELKTELGLGK